MAAFTAIAAGVGLATTAATTGMSFAQAAKQKRMALDLRRGYEASLSPEPSE